MSAVVLICLFFAGYSFSYNYNELEIISSLLQRFLIKQCILVAKPQDEIINTPKLKHFWDKNIFTLHLNFPLLINYLNGNHFPDVPTLIVLKVQNYEEVEDVLKKLNVSSITNVTSFDMS